MFAEQSTEQVKQKFFLTDVVDDGSSATRWPTTDSDQKALNNITGYNVVLKPKNQFQKLCKRNKVQPFGKIFRQTVLLHSHHICFLISILCIDCNFSRLFTARFQEFAHRNETHVSNL